MTTDADPPAPGASGTSEPLEIQRCTPAQWRLVRAVRLLAVRAEPDWFGADLPQEAARGEEDWRTTLAADAWLVALRRDACGGVGTPTGRVAGIVAGFWTDRHPDGAPQLGAMWVAPGSRGTGLAARLVGSIEQLGRTRGERSIGLWLTPGNDRAERFYRRLGYRHTGARKAAPKDPGVAMRRMRRDLSPGALRLPVPAPWDPSRG